MDKLEKLVPAQSILLAASLAANSNIEGLRAFIHIKQDLFDQELVCRIILTFLPESLDPSSYRGLLEQIASPSPDVDETYDYTTVDSSVVEDVSDSDARQLLKSLHLLSLSHPSVADDYPQDLFSHFLIHRAHRIESETALLPLVSKLIAPFLHHSQFLRDWFVGNLVPLLRLDYDYHPSEDPSYSLESFQELTGQDAVTALLSKTEQSAQAENFSAETAGRDLRGILAPCVYGKSRFRGTKRKRDPSDEHVQQLAPPASAANSELAPEWTYTNEWLVSKAASNFPLTVSVIDGWSGPNDFDLGLPEDLHNDYQLDPEQANTLKLSYCQATLASIYAAEQDTPEIIDGAHNLLVRLADLLDLIPPPDLATSVNLLPKVENRGRKLGADLMEYLSPEALLWSNNPLTIPSIEQYSLLQMLVYSAYLLANLGYSISVAKAAKLRFSSEEGEQLRLIQRVLHGRVNGPKRTEQQWSNTRDVILWLWDWALNEYSASQDDGYGIFGKVKQSAFETELLKAFCEAEQYALVSQIYLTGPVAERPLPLEDIEKVIIALTLQYFDNATNGNKTRGGVKRASEILAAFRSHFAHSQSFKQCSSLIAATHALSFYSLRIDPGVPFKPGLIRTNDDPLSLIEKVLEQNTNAYTKLDDLIEIGCNLVRANYSQHDKEQTSVSNNNGAPSELDEGSELLIAERRIIGMAVEAALHASDFETAYSYVVNRLQSPISNSENPSPSSIKIDDVSWRTALVAGRFRSTTTQAQKSNSSHTSPHVRGLEQRMELLSHALQLAPPPNLPEVLAAWRRVEEELLSVLAQEAEADQAFDDHADKGQVGPILPGSFGASHVDIEGKSGSIALPKRKELGRGSAEEAPMGLFDVARGAAAAFSRSTSGAASTSKSPGERESSFSSANTEGRQRKRDVVANAVTGGLASGIGWVLGANPVKEDG